ncbi:MAG: efflux RND transporter periplasmic adaptor subunit [Myxococcales bacterium]|nr:efflux RND transporter periplasmic adaptor subunit [Myxococcales bacterium]
MDGSGASAKERENLKKELASTEGGRKWLRRAVIFLVLAAAVAGFFVYRARNAPPPPPRFVLAELTSGEIAETVQSTGQVKPVTEVQVGAQVSGRITKVFVDFNSQVKAGEVLAEIDPTLYSAQIESSNAQLAASSASVKRAEANLEAARLRLDRAKKLVTEKVGSQADLDAAQGTYDVSVAEVAAAKAQVAQISAQLKQSKTNLEFAKILSPIDGVVITRSIDVGQTVQASFQAPTLFVLAQDLRKMRVFADIDEADVGKLKEKMAAEISVDAFPGSIFKGEVIQVRLSPVSQQGVVTYAAVIDVDNPDLKLRPGMTATVTITSAKVTGVSRVPNAALRFRPSPPMDDSGKPVPQEPLPKLKSGQGRVWVLVDETPGKEKIEPRIVDVGITDGIWTEVKTDLEGAKVVRDETDAGPGSGSGQGRRRGMF